MLRTRSLLVILLTLLVIPTYVIADSPLSWKGYALGEDVSNFHGGIKSGSILLAAGRLTALYDTEKACMWKGGQFAVGVLGIGQTHDQNLYTGAIQSPSSDAAVPEIRLTDLSYQHRFSDTVLLRAGIMDFDDYFDVMEVAINFLNYAFNNTETINYNVQLATYPYPGFGAMGQFGTKKLGLLLGVFQGNPHHQDSVFHHGQLVIGELSSHFGGSANDDMQYTLKGAVWDYQQNLRDVGTSDYGLYLIGEATWVYKDRNLGAGINLGFCPKKLNTVTDSLAASFTIGGLFKCRPKDSLNLGLGTAWFKGAPDPAETFLEVGYTIQIIDNLTLTPDLQYFIHPGCTYRNAWVGLLRLQYAIPTL